MEGKKTIHRKVDNQNGEEAEPYCDDRKQKTHSKKRVTQKSVSKTITAGDDDDGIASATRGMIANDTGGVVEAVDDEIEVLKKVSDSEI